jgi:hypothetical protein
MSSPGAPKRGATSRTWGVASHEYEKRHPPPPPKHPRDCPFHPWSVATPPPVPSTRTVTSSLLDPHAPSLPPPLSANLAPSSLVRSAAGSGLVRHTMRASLLSTWTKSQGVVPSCSGAS